MSTPEGKVKEQVKKLLKEYPTLYKFMPVQNGMGDPALDFLCCYRGMFFSVETKAPGKSLTPLQLYTVERIVNAGGQVFVVSGPEGLETLKKYLELASVTHI